ncbi:MAG: efflux RND transporter periplasmic adaptor subunit [Verrucomicrobiae bacterium]|nr:efflux RND transporter periplasmic adaptor subunit [Verrucomicrobiae bacterium]
MKTIMHSIIAAALLLMLITGCQRHGQGSSGEKYHCPMHPTYISERMGDCPICNMKLVPIKEGTPTETRDSAKPYLPKAGQYYCPMKCEGSISDRPGDCPECGMKLLLADDKKAAEFAAAATMPSLPAGRVVVQVSPERRQTIGLRTSVVEERELVREVWATAVVEHDETRYARVAPRFAGWVKEIYVNFTGQEVRAGQPLFRVFSPELMAAENEYLLALRNLRQTETNATASVARETAARLAASARKRLELWQIAPEEIAAIEERGAIGDETLIRAPFSGHVLSKAAVEGKAFMAGETLYEIADLHHVWLRLSLWEKDWPLLQTGLVVRLNFPAFPGRVFTNTITFLYPHIDPQTRRGEARLEMENPQHRLRPGMWAQAQVVIPLGRRLTAPAGAVLDTGLRHVVFVDQEDGHLEPREVKVGLRTDDYWEILEGLRPGERVVTRALFLIDSESQLKAAIAGMMAEAAPVMPATNTAKGHAH